MTAINHNSITSRHSIDDSSSRSDNGRRGELERGSQAVSDSILEHSTVNISYNAQLRLRAYQEQRVMPMPMNQSSKEETEKSEALTMNASTEQVLTRFSSNISKNTANEPIYSSNSLDKNNNGFSQHVASMLSEVEHNIVQNSEPGYNYLVNVLNNHIDHLGDQQQLQEIMRKEQFFLTRRKPFMNSSDYQSYSQVLGQFTNIIDRQQYTL